MAGKRTTLYLMRTPNVMYLAIFFDFMLQQLTSGPLLDRFFKKIPTFGVKLKRNSQERDLDDSVSDMSDEIWFDGVDKRLIEAHSKKIELVKGDDKSLLTKMPLLSYKGILKKRKLMSLTNRAKTQGKKTVTGHDETNGTTSTCQQQSTNSNIDKELAKYSIRPSTGLTDELALDCEMVECHGHQSVLARVSIVNLFGHPILDSYVEPPSKVTDYRTRYSGIRRCDLENAPNFERVQAQVARIIKDRIVVGHAIHNDFSALKLSHPQAKTRDTSHYFGRNYFLGRTPSLKKLSHSLLGITIQKGEHDSVQDAQATMKLYVKVREEWNEGVLKNMHSGKQQKKQKTKPAKKKIKAFFVETI